MAKVLNNSKGRFSLEESSKAHQICKVSTNRPIIALAYPQLSPKILPMFHYFCPSKGMFAASRLEVAKCVECSMSKLLQTQVGMVSVGHPILALFTWQPSWVMSPFCIRRSRSTSKICANVKLLERCAVDLSGPYHDET